MYMLSSQIVMHLIIFMLPIGKPKCKWSHQSLLSIQCHPQINCCSPLLIPFLNTQVSDVPEWSIWSGRVKVPGVHLGYPGGVGEDLVTIDRHKGLMMCACVSVLSSFFNISCYYKPFCSLFIALFLCVWNVCLLHLVSCIQVTNQTFISMVYSVFVNSFSDCCQYMELSIFLCNCHMFW